MQLYLKYLILKIRLKKKKKRKEKKKKKGNSIVLITPYLTLIHKGLSYKRKRNVMKMVAIL